MRHVRRQRRARVIHKRGVAVGERSGSVGEAELRPHSIEELGIDEPYETRATGTRVHADPVAGVEHSAQLAVDTDRDLTGPFEHAYADPLLDGQHETAVEHH